MSKWLADSLGFRHSLFEIRCSRYRNNKVDTKYLSPSLKVPARLDTNASATGSYTIKLHVLKIMTPLIKLSALQPY
jgi:hypothetical protein